MPHIRRYYVKDSEESEKLQLYASHLERIDKLLPIDKRFELTKKAYISPIHVANEIFTAGMASSGFRALAMILPNDEKVREQKGSKKMMLKNVIEAKFAKILRPMAEMVLEEEQFRQVAFDSYFNGILFHELSHGLGANKIILKDGTETTPNEQLKELYSPIEETKADVCGIICADYFIENGVLSRDMKRQIYTSEFVSMLRTIRFGLKEAHGKCAAAQYNYLKKEGAISYNENSDKFSIDYKKMEKAVYSLAAEILDMEAEGNYEKAKHFLDTYGHMPQEIKKTIEKLKNVPVDIMPTFF